MQKGLLTILAASTLAFAAAPQASALSALRLSDGINTTLITDDALDDLCIGIPGAVVGVFSLGNWEVDLVTGFSKEMQGSATAPLMTLHLEFRSTAAGTLTIEYSDTDFSGPHSTAYSSIGGVLGNGTAQYSTFGNTSNSLFGGEILTSSGNLSGDLTGDFHYNDQAAFQFSGLYSLTQQVVITHAGAGIGSFNADFAAVPDAGSTIVLLGLTLVGVEGLRRRLALTKVG